MLEENEAKTKTKHIKFEELDMSPYLLHNKSTALSNIIFSLRSGTLDLKYWHDTPCVCLALHMEKNIKRKELENHLWK